VCIHPMPSFKSIYLGNSSNFQTKLLPFYHDFAAYMAARWNPNELVFQLMTEPFANYTAWNNMWPSMLTSVRSAMPNHILIMSGDQSGIIEGMVNDVNPDLTTDQNILWSFTTYYPYVFTFQGGGFSNPWYPWLNNVPYPSSPSNIPGNYILSSIPSGYYSSAYNEVSGYCNTPWDMTKHRSILQPITNWQNAHPTSHPKVWCAEWGSLDRLQGNAYGGGVNPPERIQFIHDRRQALEERGIGWAYWSYNETFTVLQPTVRAPFSKSPSYSWVDTTTLHALGIACGQGDINCDGIVDYNDLKILAQQWLQHRDFPPYADIAPESNGDDMVNFLDFAVVAEHWLENVTP
jgi:endoglucanase